VDGTILADAKRACAHQKREAASTTPVPHFALFAPKAELSCRRCRQTMRSVAPLAPKREARRSFGDTGSLLDSVMTM
jgi:hypothetical protein